MGDIHPNGAALSIGLSDRELHEHIRLVADEQQTTAGSTVAASWLQQELEHVQ